MCHKSSCKNQTPVIHSSIGFLHSKPSHGFLLFFRPIHLIYAWVESILHHNILSLSLSRISCATYIKMMRKQISYVNLVEVAPAPLISHNKASNAPKLETIVEEGLMEKMDISSKKVLYALPIILSLLSYLLINRLFIIWW